MGRQSSSHMKQRKTKDKSTSARNQEVGARESTLATPLTVIDANGNVGIGTSSPAAKLDVNGLVRMGTSNNILRQFTFSPSREHLIDLPTLLGCGDNFAALVIFMAYERSMHVPGVASAWVGLVWAQRGSESQLNVIALTENGTRISARGGAGTGQAGVRFTLDSVLHAEATVIAMGGCG